MLKTQKYIKIIVSYAKQMRSGSYHFDYKYAVEQGAASDILCIVVTA